MNIYLTEGFTATLGLNGTHRSNLNTTKVEREADGRRNQGWQAIPSIPSMPKSCLCLSSSSKDGFKTGFTLVTV